MIFCAFLQGVGVGCGWVDACSCMWASVTGCCVVGVFVVGGCGSVNVRVLGGWVIVQLL
jgi:hypothetical protein